MSEPVPLLSCAPDPVASQAQSWKELKMDNTPSCDKIKPDLKQNGHCGSSSDMAPGTGLDMEVSDLDCRAAVHRNSQMELHCGATLPQQQEESPTETSCPAELLSAFAPALDKSSCKHLPASVNTSEDCSSDLLRIVKHHPSAIVFCDNTDNQVTFASGSSDGEGESSSSNTEEGEGDDDEDDEFPETLQYKEFLVSRRRRNLSRNRKCLRKRQDAQPSSTASGWQKPTNKGKPEFTGSQEEEENNGKQHALYQRASFSVSSPPTVFSHLSEQPSVSGTFP
ncbi:stAR-related lipid transfer protein 13-like isoform X1 [Lates japonicus]|uniref:StAR-related lipid transfer protein 13-like isoform X1 n=1 Tax=Lates japonicus TaxID=270547 RepID=A0AAD3M351_LATJO|nr:stAR-related lipid transfer protein 13-like isoform X1 [Lates japonicus]